jgi:small subunit ribosomal protein S16
MSVKIRLQRKGRKKTAYYYIVVADSRSPRDGRFIERIGSYNPLPKIAQIEVDMDKALDWLQKGATPTKTVHSLFSQQGVLYKKHLLRGIKMGVITEEDADKKFAEYLQAKSDKVNAHLEKIQSTLDKESKLTLERESKINEVKAKALMVKHAKAMEKARPKHEEEPVEEEAPETDTIAEAEATTEEVAE